MNKNPQITANKLTVLVPFMNEGEEVAATVRDVRRTASDGVDILVVNDCSTDGYDYKRDLEQYNVTYIENKENKGSAPSRDICVENCQTPYFLFLDAHMRFFCERWAKKIVNLLETNDRQLLCLQTISLKKDDAGVHINKKDSPAYGAYMPLSMDGCLPDIKWNRKEFDPQSPTQEIPMVLGAAYAGSKRYWQYLRGMEGMMRYGTEEQCISLKVWLEGGRCLLLKDLKVGHIYRKNSPFKRYADVELFNKLWVASLLFPSYLKSKSFAIAQKETGQTFVKALNILRSKKDELAEQKAYFKKIFARSFDSIIQMNRKVLLANLDVDINKNLHHSQELAKFLKNRDCQRHGLIDGLAGDVMWFEHYWRYSGQKEWDDYASLLWEQVICAVEDRTLPWYFATGTAGIGWLIHYLYNHGFIDRLPDDTLELIDKQVSEVALDCVKDTSIDFGLSGIMAYCCVRRRFSKQNPFPNSFSKRITDSADFIIHNSNNVRELSFAYYWKSLAREEQTSEYEIPLSVNDIVEVRENFAQNSEYWNDCIDFSVLASFILKFSATEKICKNKNPNVNPNDYEI